MDRVQVDVVRTLPAFLELEPVWNVTVRDSPGRAIHVSFPWLRAWWETYGVDHQMRVMIARAGDRVVGLAPLMIETRMVGRLRVPVLRLVGNDVSPRSDVILVDRKAEVMAAFVGAMLALPWWCFDLGRVPAGSEAVRLLEGHVGGGFSSMQRRQLFPTPVVSLDGSWPAYLSGKSRNFRRALRRAVAGAGERTIRSFPDDFDDFELMLKGVNRVSEATWAHREGTSLAASRLAGAFFQRVMRDAHHDGRLTVVFLYDGDVPDAFTIFVGRDDVLYALKTGYRQESADAAPGFGLLAASLQREFQRGRWRRVDLDSAATPEDWKSRWATHTEEVVSYYLFRRSGPSRVAGALYRGKKWAERRSEPPRTRSGAGAKSIVTMTGARACTTSWATDLEGAGTAAELTDLLAAVPGTTLFNTWEWASCAAATLPPGRSLHVLSVRKHGALVAWVPLTAGIERIHGVRVRSLRLLGDPLADRVALTVSGDEPGARGVVLDALAGFPGRWDVILLSELAEDRALMELVDGWATERGRATHWRHGARSPLLALDHPDVHALRASYPRTLVTRLRRSRQRLEAAGEVRFERRLPEPSEVEPLLHAFKAIEDASWKGTEGLGIFGSAERFAFFHALSRALARRGWLDVGLLRLDGRLISYRYGFRFRGAFLDYNLAYDPRFAKLSPGRILLDEMIASSLTSGLSAVDASRGALGDAHQLGEWTDRYTDHYDLWILNSTLRGRALAVLRNRVRPGVGWLRARSGLRSRRPG